jgi:hypothetical protein
MGTKRYNHITFGVPPATCTVKPLKGVSKAQKKKIVPIKVDDVGKYTFLL